MEMLKNELLAREVADYTAWKAALAAYGFTPEGTVRLCRAAGLPEKELAGMSDYIRTMEVLVAEKAPNMV